MGSEQTISNIVLNGITTNEERELLGNSLFYYCSGMDPSPVIAFGADYPLYVYSDITEKFEEYSETLYRRLQNAGYVLMCKERFPDAKRLDFAKNKELSKLATRDGRFFSLLYLNGDAEYSFMRIYSDNNNYIQPKCVCNFRYDFYGENEAYYFGVIEKRVQFILGYCGSEKYKEVGKYQSYSDYEPDSKISLYQRRYWYVY